VTTRLRPILAGTLTALAALLVFVALVVPDHLARVKPGQFVPGAFLRIPLEGIVAAAVLLVVPARARRATAVLIGLGIGVLTVLKAVNMGFLNVLGRRFDPVLDWPLLGDGYNYLVETSGRTMALAAVAGVVAAGAATLGVPAWAVLRLSGVAARHHRAATRAVPAVVAAWVAFALAGVQLFPYAPVASDTTLVMARNAVLTVPSALQDRKAFEAEAAADAFAAVPAEKLLTGLRGKDVVFGVIESYGRSALENPKMAATIDPALQANAAELTRAGFSARSAYLTSSTYGGGSWLAHATFQSGLWIDHQQRYRQLTAGKRLTLTKAFQKAGWHTAGIEPGNTKAWPEADFYGYDEVYDSRNLGYRGPQFGWSRIPDQFALAQFQKNVYARPGRGPLMAEVSLTSSHTPWAPIPQHVAWDAVGDGTVYGPIAAAARSKAEVWTSTGKVRGAYAESVVYSIGSLLSWATTYGNDNLVLVFFGDHQASPTVSGRDASHDVPITVVAKDPAVLDRIAGWGWQDGIRPDEAAPVWRMNEFRDRFLTAFAATPAGRRH
jgi:hypothetical protein